MDRWNHALVAGIQVTVDSAAMPFLNRGSYVQFVSGAPIFQAVMKTELSPLLAGVNRMLVCR